mmetsp:Transcript_21544/g.29783  ORF Transcript_21544/g.29783 Transcript_21544/m.29783 type:complete len:477 (-) Transcript_21544:228-1658(-)
MNFNLLLLYLNLGHAVYRNGFNRARYMSMANSYHPSIHSVTDNPRVSILTEISDEPGALHELLRYFWKFDIDLTHIESRPSTKSNTGFNIYIDFAGRLGDIKTDNLIVELKRRCNNMLILDEKEVPWFPRHISEIDRFAKNILNAGSNLSSDHPGFNDPIYRTRREELTSIAQSYSFGESIPYISYTSEEIKTWGTVYSKLHHLHQSFACEEFLRIIPQLEKHCGYGVHNIPQAQDISDFLKQQTGFQLRPVAGLLSSRHFLNGLAFRTFFSTQYIRHPSRPFYTPEPDICHELLGHVPMFADPDFADFSQEIGLASLGASDEVIRKLASCYWFSVEFGLLFGKEKENKRKNGMERNGVSVKAYGAGLLSSFGELEYACGGDLKSLQSSYTPPITSSLTSMTSASYLPWDPTVACTTPYPITTYQPLYFVAETLTQAKLELRAYCESLPRPFFARYNALTNSIWVDRAVRPNNSTE